MRVQRLAFRDLTPAHRDQWRAYVSVEPTRHSPYYQLGFFDALVTVKRPVEVLVAEDGQGVLAFLPFEQRGSRTIPAGGGMNDYQGPICRPGSSPNPVALIRGGGLSSYRYNHLYPADLSGWARFNIKTMISPQQFVAGGAEAYADRLRSGGQTGEFKTSQRLGRKLAREVGELNFTLDDREPETLDYLIRWKSQQYRETGAPDGFEDAWRGELLRNLLQSRDPEFRGLLASLRAGEQLVAVHYYLQSGKILHSWFPTYDANYARYSPGRVLAVTALDAMAEQGVEVMDMGKGDAMYKLRSMTQSVDVAEGVVDAVILRVWGRRLRHQFVGWLRKTALYGRLRSWKRRVKGKA